MVEKLTRTEGTALPCWSSTRARTFEVPPPIGNVCGAAVTTIRVAVAAPMSTSMVDVAPPEVARTTAVPDIPLPTSRAVARPEVVSAVSRLNPAERRRKEHLGAVVNGGAAPWDDLARLVVRPGALGAFDHEGRDVGGAIGGNRTRRGHQRDRGAGRGREWMSHDPAATAPSIRAPRSAPFAVRKRARPRSIIRADKDSTFMYLAGQGARQPSPSVQKLDDGGYIMVVLLIGIAVSAVWMGAMLPAWRHQVVRQKEAELIFRGEAYARAIALYWRKNNQTLPPSFDILVSQRYLRKKYLDPMTNKEFLAIGGIGPGSSSPAPTAGGRGPGAAGGLPGPTLGPADRAARADALRGTRRHLGGPQHEHGDLDRRVSGPDVPLAVSVRLHRGASAHGRRLTAARGRCRRRTRRRPPRRHRRTGPARRRSRASLSRSGPSRSARTRSWHQRGQGIADRAQTRPRRPASAVGVERRHNRIVNARDEAQGARRLFASDGSGS